ncbi:MAG: hypothetical protein ACRCYT_05340 [Cetobacterium sp.]
MKRIFIFLIIVTKFILANSEPEYKVYDIQNDKTTEQIYSGIKYVDIEAIKTKFNKNEFVDNTIWEKDGEWSFYSINKSFLYGEAENYSGEGKYIYIYFYNTGNTILILDWEENICKRNRIIYQALLDNASNFDKYNLKEAIEKRKKQYEIAPPTLSFKEEDADGEYADANIIKYDAEIKNYKRVNILLANLNTGNEDSVALALSSGPEVGEIYYLDKIDLNSLGMQFMELIHLNMRPKKSNTEKRSEKMLDEIHLTAIAVQVYQKKIKID